VKPVIELVTDALAKGRVVATRVLMDLSWMRRQIIVSLLWPRMRMKNLAAAMFHTTNCDWRRAVIFAFSDSWRTLHYVNNS
jgi:hypothetical protein